jgi:hypothetical protein
LKQLGFLRWEAVTGVVVMLIGLAAVPVALGLLSTLQSQTSEKAASVDASGAAGFAPPGLMGADGSAAGKGADSTRSGNGSTAIAPDTMNALLTAQGQSTSVTRRKSPLEELFTAMDADSDGKVSKSEFEDALGQNGNLQLADDVFVKMDKDGDGSLTLGEMTSALKGRGHHHGARGAGQSLDGSSASTVANADGSTSTTITYADGSKVTMTRPAGDTSYNALERMIARQAEMLAAKTESSVAVSA